MGSSRSEQVKNGTQRDERTAVQIRILASGYRTHKNQRTTGSNLGARTKRPTHKTIPPNDGSNYDARTKRPTHTKNLKRRQLTVQITTVPPSDTHREYLERSISGELSYSEKAGSLSRLVPRTHYEQRKSSDYQNEAGPMTGLFLDVDDPELEV